MLAGFALTAPLLSPALAADASGVTATVVSGPFLLAGLLALAAGVVSFASPCVVPLVPGYLAYLAGLVGAEAGVARPLVGVAGPGASHLAASSGVPVTAVTPPGSPVTAVTPPGSPVTAVTPPGSPVTAVTQPGFLVAATAPAGRASRVRWRAVGATALFVAGFSAVFLAESALALGLYTTLIRNQDLLMRISGGVAILMGLVLAGAVPLLQREWRVRIRPVSRATTGGRGRIWAAPVLGLAFGTGWLACTSPTLAGIIALSSATDWNGNALRGLALVLLYCAGLGVPFLLLAIGFGWAGTAVAFLRRHARGIQLGGAVALVAIGVLMVTGAWGAVLARLQGAAVWL